MSRFTRAMLIGGAVPIAAVQVTAAVLGVLSTANPVEAQLRQRRPWEYTPRPPQRYQPRREWRYTPRDDWRYTPKRDWNYRPRGSAAFQRKRGLLQDLEGIPIAADAYRITTTHPVVTDAVVEIGGRRARIEEIDPDTYRLRPGSVPGPFRAEIIIYLDHQALNATLQRWQRFRPVYAVSRLAGTASLQHGVSAPWLDIERWRGFAQEVALQLSDYDPEYRGYYAYQYRQFADQLDQLQDYARSTFESIAPENRKILVDGGDFTSFAQAYGFEIYTLRGLHKDSPVPRDFITALQAAGIRSIFTVDRDHAAAEHLSSLLSVAAEADYPLNIAGTLYCQLLGPSGSYAGMMRHNVATIIAGLQHEPRQSPINQPAAREPIRWWDEALPHGSAEQQ